MEGESSGAFASHCIPTRVGSKFVYFEGTAGKKVTLEVREKGQNEVSISGKLPNGKEVSCQLRHNRSTADPSTGDPFNEFLLWLTKADNGCGLSLTFGSRGLALPMVLTVGNTISATPDEINPTTGNRLHVTYQVAKFEQIHVRPELPLEQENGMLTTPCLRTSLIIKDEKQGTRSSYDIWLLPGSGVVRLAGSTMGVPLVLELIELCLPP